MPRITHSWFLILWRLEIVIPHTALLIPHNLMPSFPHTIHTSLTIHLHLYSWFLIPYSIYTQTIIPYTNYSLDPDSIFPVPSYPYTLILSNFKPSYLYTIIPLYPYTPYALIPHSPYPLYQKTMITWYYRYIRFLPYLLINTFTYIKIRIFIKYHFSLSS